MSRTTRISTMNRFTFQRSGGRVSRWCRVRRALARTGLGLGVLTTLVMLPACSPDRLVRSDAPSSLVDPNAISTPAGALALYNGATNVFSSAFGGAGSGTTTADNYVASTGIFTDEFETGVFGNFVLDGRVNAQQFSAGKESAQAATYSKLQAARIAAFQARQALQLYGTPSDSALIGRMYSVEAYSIVLLAEYFCNGVPLSQVPLSGNPVYAAGNTTDQLYAQASALFDTAMTWSADSSNFLNLAKVGKGRLLLDQAKFAEAAAAVDGVPLTFVYNAEFLAGGLIQLGGTGYGLNNGIGTDQNNYNLAAFATRDREGTNGLTWTGDVRIALTPQSFTDPDLWSDKYPTGSTSIRVADGIEASLIRAEALLNAAPDNGAWLDTLNALRATCTTASGCAPVPNVVPESLPTLIDSGTPVGRLHQLMSERARWLYATGHRQGDLRRMLRAPYKSAPYNMTDTKVYPTGPYRNNFAQMAANFGIAMTVTAYGTDVVAIPSRAERQYNRNFTGCFDLNP